MLQNIIKNFNAQKYRSEESVRLQICYPILRQLGWAVDDPHHLEPEFSINNNRRVDIALFNGIDDAPCILMEIKKIGHCSADGEEQLFNYASVQGGAPMVILTDGIEWHFFNIHGVGGYEQRKVTTVNITAGNLQESIDTLNRYLWFEKVENGNAFIHLREDYDEKRKNMLAKNKITEAWHAIIIDDENDLIVRLLQDKVLKLSGHKPKQKDVIAFLKNLNHTPVASEIRKPIAQQPLPQTPSNSLNNNPPQNAPLSNTVIIGKDKKYNAVSYRYKINNLVHKESKGKDVFTKALDYVIAKYGYFDELKSQNFNKSKAGGYRLSEYKAEVHVPDKANEDTSKAELPNCKIWVSTHSSSPQKTELLRTVGKFYERKLNRKILGDWDSGAEVEFDIPTQTSN
ncbi:MAG: type I restriction enzyme HsdR N-terminal domain-containing protein [Alphaproteobacteria bacterium]|nr:type I restriction enzyme HsdR N-terminal domain-containing protein [Alphaproteobacteria bacterium]